MAKLAALTLMRLSEIRLLRREQVHLEQGVVVFPNGWPWSRHYVSHVHENPIVLDGSGRMW